MKQILTLLLTMAALTAGAKDYNICDFGAVSHLQTLSTTAIQAAIDRCHADGGGRVVVPAGKFVTGTIVLKSNVNLHLEHGAILYGSTDLKDYRRMRSSYVSLRTQTETVQLLYADSVENVVIDGHGTIDGRGSAFPKLSWNDEGITRPHLLRFIQSRDITVKDITLRNSGCWMQHYLACDRVRLTGLRIFNRNNYNNDALDLDGCHDVVVSNLIADSDDDGITLKSTSPRLCENITIQNCVVSSHCNAVKLGTESNGGFRNIHISGITVRPSADQSTKFFGNDRGTSALSLEVVDGGIMENVVVSGMTIIGTESPIFVRLGHRGRGWLEGQHIEQVGRLRGVTISDIRAIEAGNIGCSITGLPEHPVEDVVLRDVYISQCGGMTEVAEPTDEKAAEYPEATMWGPLPATGFFVRHARGVHFERVEVSTEQPDARPSFFCDDVE